MNAEPKNFYDSRLCLLITILLYSGAGAIALYILNTAQ